MILKGYPYQHEADYYNHASNVTGTLIPIREIGRIAREHEILYRSMGNGRYNTDDLSSLPVDMMAMSGHKGLLGPQGTGVLYKLPMKLKQLKEGGTGSQSESLFIPNSYPTAMKRAHNSPELPGWVPESTIYCGKDKTNCCPVSPIEKFSGCLAANTRYKSIRPRQDGEPDWSYIHKCQRF